MEKTKNLIALPKSGLYGFGAFTTESVASRLCDYCRAEATKFVWSKDIDGAFNDIESYACDSHDEHFAKLNARA
jgi:hypothetical protein